MADGREPAPLSSGDIPSSFDSDTDFFEESRSSKLFRKVRQEPLIPLGCLATCYALYQATKSIRQGDHHQTNRMFRARIYAQGFTLVAIVAGSIFYKDERMKKKTIEKEVEKQRAAEKRDKWLKELEARDAEDQAWRRQIEETSGEAAERARQLQAGMGRQSARVNDALKDVKSKVEDTFSSKSMSERIIHQTIWSRGTGISEAWRRM